MPGISHAMMQILHNMGLNPQYGDLFDGVGLDED